MIPEVKLVSCTDVNYPEFIGFAASSGIKITKSLDDEDLPVETLASFIASLDCLRNENSDPIKAVRQGGGLLEHLHFGFAVSSIATHVVTEILEVTGLKGVTKSQNNFAIFSGSLAMWYTSILHCCNRDRSFGCRILINKILILFERHGLGEVWGYFGKETLKDKSYILYAK